MASRTVIQLIDDIDGSEIQEGGQTVRFSFSGVDYSIDLNPQNVEKFENALKPYLEAATRVGGRRSRSGGPTEAKSAGEVDTKAVRAWAASNGVELSSRGRISADVIEKYREAGH